MFRNGLSNELRRLNGCGAQRGDVSRCLKIKQRADNAMLAPVKARTNIQEW